MSSYLGTLTLSVLLWALLAKARIFERCELGYELTDKGIIPQNWTHEIVKWLCIANISTSYDTDYFDDSGGGNLRSYGVLKITNNWCEDGLGSTDRCGVSCTDLQGDNISATVMCASEIYRVNGNSFTPWQPAWNDVCQYDATHYVTGCERDITFTTPGGIIEVVEGDNLTLPCTVKSYPRPELSWEWDDEPEEHIIPSSLQLIDIEYNMYLNFYPVKAEDIGKSFTCRAINSDGGDKTEVFVLGRATDDGSTTPQSIDTTTESDTDPSSTTDTDTVVSSTISEDFTTSEPTTEERTTSDPIMTTETLMTSSSPVATITTVITTPTITTSSLTSSTSSPPTTTTSTSRTTTVNPIIPTTPSGPEKIFEACELAGKLTYLFNDTCDWNEHLEWWLCLSEKAADFNASFLQQSSENSRLWHYGIFKISNQWCNDGYSNGNKCNVPCNNLFSVNLRDSVRCSQQIHGEKGFTEWPEDSQYCIDNPTNYTQKCLDKPFFVVNDDSATEKNFVERDLDKSISCAASGYPPPKLVWDAETMNYIQDSESRILSNESRAEDIDGNWTMRYTLIFTQVWLTDNRTYLCNASNRAGSENLSYIVNVLPYPEAEDSNDWPLGITIGGGILLGLLGLFAIPITYAMYRLRKKRNENILQIYENFKYGSQNTDPGTQSTAVLDAQQEYLSQLPDAEYETYSRVLELPFSKALEILPHRLELQSSALLGSGAFGVVFKGVLDQKLVVAVKTVPKGSDESKLAALLSEVKIMSYVGSHPNIVGLFGVQIMDLRKGIAFVAVEYCSRGSLEDVLHAKRRELESRKYIQQTNFNIPGYLDATSNVAKPFTTYQLLTFSHQVSSAMEYLASKKIIHGDLAARNVLLDINFVAKISDFGLSKQIYDNYKKYVFAAKETALPWRWLAIETLRELRFSTESDVWAFGIFLWEVFSLAQLPYSAGISWGPEFVKYLERGFRLEKPEFATQEIYQIMRQCWEADPQRRIKFQQLSITLLCFIEAEYKKYK